MTNNNCCAHNYSSSSSHRKSFEHFELDQRNEDDLNASRVYLLLKHYASVVQAFKKSSEEESISFSRHSLGHRRCCPRHSIGHNSFFSGVKGKLCE